MKKYRTSPQSLAAEGTYKAYLRLKNYLREGKIKRNGIQILINRKPYLNKKQPFKTIDMINFVEAHRRPPSNFLDYWFYFIVSFGLMAYIPILLWDQHHRYFLYVHFPSQMYYLDQFTAGCRSKYEQIEKNYLLNLSPDTALNTPYGWASYKKKVKSFLFKSEEKTEAQSTQEKEVKKQAQDIDAELEAFTNFMKSQDSKLQTILSEEQKKLIEG